MSTSRDELLRKWVEALESGKYKQARNTLRFENSYCCLGVACNLFDDAGWEVRPERGPGCYAYIAGKGTMQQASHSGFLPRVIREAIGVTPGHEGALADANDRGETFPQIAKRIRAMFPDVFAPRPLAGQRRGE